jgi:superfamily I DNA and/or RNA helicase
MYGTRSFLPPIAHPVFIKLQYRFSATLARFPSESFYNGELMSSIQDLEEHQQPLRQCALIRSWPLRGNEIFPVIFVQCDSEEEPFTRSKWNQGQIDVVKKLVKQLTTQAAQNLEGEQEQQEVLPSIAVITPYSRQCSEIAKALRSGITATTIDGYQGRESDIIVFSTVRKNVTKDLGFLEDMRRINVAWTRARLALFIVGDRATLSENELWRRAISDEYCRELHLTPEGEFRAG